MLSVNTVPTSAVKILDLQSRTNRSVCALKMGFDDLNFSSGLENTMKKLILAIFLLPLFFKMMIWFQDQN